MEYPNNYSSHTEELPDGQLMSGTVLFVSLVLMNVILLLNWLGFISIT